MIEKSYFGTFAGGIETEKYTMTNEAGMTVSVLDYGGILQRMTAKNRDGVWEDVILGFDNPADYEQTGDYLGALVGRVANRIAYGKYTLDGKKYQLAINNGVNSLHGGAVGFSMRHWDVTAIDGDEPMLTLKLFSPDGEENYPGNLHVTVTYTLTKDNALAIHYTATTDKLTIVNLTNHVYFNLSAFEDEKVFDHLITMEADRYLPIDEELIPTGEIKAVRGTPFDFNAEKSIGRDFDLADHDLAIGDGYDHCLCFTGGATKAPVARITVRHAASGRRMEVLTDQPSVQLYSGNFLKAENPPYYGRHPQGQRAGFCLETQKFPDAINHPNFTDVTLRPDGVYEHTTIYRFSVDE